MFVVHRKRVMCPQKVWNREVNLKRQSPIAYRSPPNMQGTPYFPLYSFRYAQRFDHPPNHSQPWKLRQPSKPNNFNFPYFTLFYTSYRLTNSPPQCEYHQKWPPPIPPWVEKSTQIFPICKYDTLHHHYILGMDQARYANYNHLRNSGHAELHPSRFFYLRAGEARGVRIMLRLWWIGIRGFRFRRFRLARDILGWKP